MDEKTRKIAKAVLIKMAVVVLLILAVGFIVRIARSDRTESDPPAVSGADEIELDEESIIF